MPDPAIPKLKLPTGHSSTDASSSERSNNSAPLKLSDSARKRNNQSAPLGYNKKSRRSITRRGCKKPGSIKNGASPKRGTVQELKTQIPRALLLTPSTSSASLKTHSSSSTSLAEREVDSSIVLHAEHAPQNSVTATATTTPTHVAILTPSLATTQTQQIQPIQNQYTAAILNFRIRKSVSQMDFKRIHRGVNYSATMANGKTIDIENLHSDSNALVPNSSSSDSGAVLPGSSQTSLVNKIFDQNSYYYVIKDNDPKVAGMRIFATIMLNAWRKRRNEVKCLTEEVNELKRGSVKTKNQLHVFNTLFRVEQKRNDELSCQLKRSLEDINNTKSSCESLTTSLISLKADKALLEQQIQIKEQEFDGLNAILSQTKSELFKAMSVQRELQASLSSEQRKVQNLESQKNELINEICEVNNESLQKEENLRASLIEKEDALKTANERINELENEITDLVCTTASLNDHLAHEAQLRQEVDKLQAQVNTLQQCLAATVGNRIKSYWNNTVGYQKSTLQLLHWVAFCALPAAPPPKISSFPFGLTLEKALSIVKR